MTIIFYIYDDIYTFIHIKFKAFDAGTPDILIIDEVHELTPEIVMVYDNAILF